MTIKIKLQELREGNLKLKNAVNLLSSQLVYIDRSSNVVVKFEKLYGDTLSQRVCVLFAVNLFFNFSYRMIAVMMYKIERKYC